MCTVCLLAFIVQHSVNREGKKTKVDSQCNYRLTGMEMRESEGEAWGGGVSVHQDIKVEILI